MAFLNFNFKPETLIVFSLVLFALVRQSISNHENTPSRNLLEEDAAAAGAVPQLPLEVPKAVQTKPVEVQKPDAADPAKEKVAGETMGKELEVQTAMLAKGVEDSKEQQVKGMEEKEVKKEAKKKKVLAKAEKKEEKADAKMEEADAKGDEEREKDDEKDEQETPGTQEEVKDAKVEDKDNKAAEASDPNIVPEETSGGATTESNENN